MRIKEMGKGARSFARGGVVRSIARGRTGVRFPAGSDAVRDLRTTATRERTRRHPPGGPVGRSCVPGIKGSIAQDRPGRVLYITPGSSFGLGRRLDGERAAEVDGEQQYRPLRALEDDTAHLAPRGRVLEVILRR